MQSKYSRSIYLIILIIFQLNRSLHLDWLLLQDQSLRVARVKHQVFELREVHGDLQQLLFSDLRHFLFRQVGALFRHDGTLAAIEFLMLGESGHKSEHHLALVALYRLLTVRAHVQVEQTLLLELLLTHFTWVDLSAVVRIDVVLHQITAKVKRLAALSTVEMRQDLTILVNISLVYVTHIASTERARTKSTRQHQLCVVTCRHMAQQQLLMLKHLPTCVALMMLEMLPQMIAQRLNALVGSLACATLNNEVLPMMRHVQSNVVLRVEHFAALIAEIVARNVTRLHVPSQLLLGGQLFVTHRTNVHRHLLDVIVVVRIELGLLMEYNIITLALTIAATKQRLLGLIEFSVALQLDFHVDIGNGDAATDLLLHQALDMQPIVVERLIVLVDGRMADIVAIVKLFSLRDLLVGQVFDDIVEIVEIFRRLLFVA